MQISQTIPSVLSANDLFKAQYQKALRWSLLVALLLTSLGVWLMPAYHPNPYVLREDFLEIQDFEIVEDFELPIKQQIKPPVVIKEIEPVTGDVVDDFVLPNTFEFDYYDGGNAPIWQDPVDAFSPTSSNPVLMHFAKPDYPEIARRSRLEGMVIVKVLVGKSGLVEQTIILQGANPILNKAAADAAKKCRFKPGTQRTMPVKAWMAIPYSFKLN